MSDELNSQSHSTPLAVHGLLMLTRDVAWFRRFILLKCLWWSSATPRWGKVLPEAVLDNWSNWSVFIGSVWHITLDLSRKRFMMKSETAPRVGFRRFLPSTEQPARHGTAPGVGSTWCHVTLPRIDDCIAVEASARFILWRDKGAVRYTGLNDAAAV